jgi:NAD(P)-dependent dehydrogenase (short-subunit alcohol dehydrogenase family)
MTNTVGSPAAGRVKGPRTTWYDLHEAIVHEVDALAAVATTLDVTTIGAFAARFDCFAGELRTHSKVEDGIMFRNDPDALVGRVPGRAPRGLGYGTTCAAIETTSQRLAVELRPSGVRVVYLRPHLIANGPSNGELFGRRAAARASASSSGSFSGMRT